jgi:DNA replication protein DnaC
MAAAIACSLLELSARVRFLSASVLVQLLQPAKVSLQLQTALLKLDKYDLLILDNLSYVKKSEAETSVLI